MVDALSAHLNDMAFKMGVSSHLAHDIFVGPLALSTPIREALDNMTDEQQIELIDSIEAEIRNVLSL